MKYHCFLRNAFLCLALFFGLVTGNECDEELLERLVNALEQSVQYMDEHKSELNLDGAASLTMVTDQMNVLWNSYPVDSIHRDLQDKLRNIKEMANGTIEESKSLLKQKKADQFEAIGHLMDRGTWELYYPVRHVNRSLMVTPLPCKDIKFSEEMSDYCISQLANNSRNAYSPKCQATEWCWDYMTQPYYKDYALTHELIYLIVGETHKCFTLLSDEMQEEIKYMQNSFCANVLRDAEELARNNYPAKQIDLFLEQIGICSMFSFIDFLKREWIEMTLSWREPTGCYVSPGSEECSDDKSVVSKRRRKRESVTLQDGCSSHMTAVGILAMMVETKFCIEVIANNSTAM